MPLTRCNCCTYCASNSLVAASGTGGTACGVAGMGRSDSGWISGVRAEGPKAGGKAEGKKSQDDVIDAEYEEGN